MNNYRITFYGLKDGDVEICYYINENKSFMIISAGLVNDLHIDRDELKSLGLLENYNRILSNHFKAI